MVDGAYVVNIITTQCPKMKVPSEYQDLDRAAFVRIFPVN